jgi:hypothetical protein
VQPYQQWRPIMAFTTDKRPPPEGRASKEEASSRVFVLPRKPPGQPSEQTSARVWIGDRAHYRDPAKQRAQRVHWA